MYSNFNGFRLGWLRDFPDNRDYGLDSDKVTPFVILGAKNELPETGHISIPLPEPREQGSLGSCTAHAGTYLFEIHQRVANPNDSIEPMSRLFLYKVSRNLAGVEGDTGSFLRTTMQAMVMFGVLPEMYDTYEIRRYDEEPTAFQFAMAQNFQALTYYKLDSFGSTPDEIIGRVKANINANRACMFGFTVYGIDDKTGNVLLPVKNQSIVGGHAVTCVGYDDKHEIAHPNNIKTIGSFKFANWWGKEFGENGFGWIPYEFVKLGLAVDWWTLMSTEWVNLGNFK